jgi:FkbM family methyltransferase
LGNDGQLIYLQHDKVMAPYVNRFGYWDKDLSKFIVSNLNNSNSKSIFLDIGANQGLITLQVINGCNNLKNIEFILVEPIVEFFSNLQRNILPFNGIASYELLNFGLGLVSNPNAYAYTSGRNSTSTEHLNITLDPKDKLKINDIAIVSVSHFIESYLDTKTYSQLIVKSDTDGNDLEIFDCFVNSTLRDKIRVYALEVILTSITKSDLDIFIKNCCSFNKWILKLRTGEELTDKTTIKNILRSKRHYVGDLYLSC